MEIEEENLKKIIEQNIYTIGLSEVQLFIMLHRLELLSNKFMTLQDIGNHLNITRSRVHQIERGCFRKIRIMILKLTD